MQKPMTSVSLGLAAAVTTLLLLSGCQTAPSVNDQAVTKVRGSGQVYQASGKLKAVEHKKRDLAVKYPHGRMVKVHCEPEVTNFEQLRLDRDITASFEDIAELVPAGQAQGGAAAAQGKRPGGSPPKLTELNAQLVKVDPATRQVTLRESSGATHVLNAAPEVQNLAELAPGTPVVARFFSAVRIDLGSR